MTFRRGDFVRLRIDTWTTKAFVALASENGRSLFVMFDGIAPVAGGGLVGSLPLLQEDDGTWREIMCQTPVAVESLEASAPSSSYVCARWEGTDDEQ